MRPAGLVLALLVASGLTVAGAGVDAAATPGAASCRVLAAPASLGATLLRLHRAYERHQPDVHNPTITGPVGRIDLGVCGASRYALGWFDARYNGFFFGTEDQPERFVEPAGGSWRDLGNTGGDPCGAAPTALLVAWKLVPRCPA